MHIEGINGLSRKVKAFYMQFTRNMSLVEGDYLISKSSYYSGVSGLNLTREYSYIGDENYEAVVTDIAYNNDKINNVRANEAKTLAEINALNAENAEISKTQNNIEAAYNEKYKKRPPIEAIEEFISKYHELSAKKISNSTTVENLAPELIVNTFAINLSIIEKNIGKDLTEDLFSLNADMYSMYGLNIGQVNHEVDPKKIGGADGKNQSLLNKIKENSSNKTPDIMVFIYDKNIIEDSSGKAREEKIDKVFGMNGDEISPKIAFCAMLVAKGFLKSEDLVNHGPINFAANQAKINAEAERLINAGIEKINTPAEKEIPYKKTPDIWNLQ